MNEIYFLKSENFDLKDGTYENGYLPMQEENIVTIYYKNEYLKYLEKLAKEK